MHAFKNDTQVYYYVKLVLMALNRVSIIFFLSREILLLGGYSFFLRAISFFSWKLFLSSLGRYFFFWVGIFLSFWDISFFDKVGKPCGRLTFFFQVYSEFPESYCSKFFDHLNLTLSPVGPPSRGTPFLVEWTVLSSLPPQPVLFQIWYGNKLKFF